MDHKEIHNSSHKQSAEQLYGLRTLAIALVVASHCSFLNQGGLMVCIMFCLSGFLAVRPFSETGFQIHSITDVPKYYIKKLINIFPSYCIILVGLKLLSDAKLYTWEELARLLVFADGPIHLWYLQQTMVMYLVTPLIILLFQIISKPVQGTKRFLLLTLLSVVLAFVARRYLENKIIFHGNVDRLWMLYQYVVGMSYGYLFMFFRESGIRQIILSKRIGKGMVNFLTLVLFSMIFISSEQVLTLFNPAFKGYYIGWAEPFKCSFFAGLLFFLITLDDNCWLSKLLKTPAMVTLGKASYETYIVHWYLLGALKYSSNNIKHFILVYIGSVAIALLVHKASAWFSRKTTRLLKLQTQ